MADKHEPVAWRYRPRGGNPPAEWLSTTDKAKIAKVPDHLAVIEPLYLASSPPARPVPDAYGEELVEELLALPLPDGPGTSMLEAFLPMYHERECAEIIVSHLIQSLSASAEGGWNEAVDLAAGVTLAYLDQFEEPDSYIISAETVATEIAGAIRALKRPAPPARTEPEPAKEGE